MQLIGRNSMGRYYSLLATNEDILVGKFSSEACEECFEMTGRRIPEALT